MASLAALQPGTMPSYPRGLLWGTHCDHCCCPCDAEGKMTKCHLCHLETQMSPSLHSPESAIGLSVAVSLLGLPQTSGLTRVSLPGRV